MTSITPEKLKVGLYIHLDHSWREHPFLRNSFQITSQKDIQAIREHGLTKISFDQEKSSTEALEALGLLEVAKQEAKEVEPEEAQSHQEQDEVKPTIGEITTEMRRETIQKAKKVYTKAINKGRAMHNIMAEDPEKGLAMATEMVASMLDDVRGDLAAVSLASTTSPTNPRDEALMHGLNVSTISMMLGRDFDLSQDDLSSMGLGALLLSLGTKTMEKLPSLPDNANEVIKYCRKEPNGSGGSSEAKDSPKGVSAEIVSVVQAYNDLTATGSITPTDALSRLYKETTDERSREIVTALICSMTIYPPGSFVRLTDDSIALVISPNSENRMKPLVLRYDPAVPRDQAMFIDLAKEDEISIQKHVSRKSLPPEVVAYLNPSKVSGYSVPPSSQPTTS